MAATKEEEAIVHPATATVTNVTLTTAAVQPLLTTADAIRAAATQVNQIQAVAATLMEFAILTQLSLTATWTTLLEVTLHQVESVKQLQARARPSQQLVKPALKVRLP